MRSNIDSEPCWNRNVEFGLYHLFIYFYYIYSSLEINTNDIK